MRRDEVRVRIGTLLGVLLLGCAVQPAARRKGATAPYKDAVLVAGVATGTAAAATGVVVGSAAAVAVATAVVGAEQFPDPPAGTPPTSTEPKEPRKCGTCVCFGKGKGPDGLGSYYDPRGGGGLVEFTRETCQKQCKKLHYTGFKCTGDNDVNWFN
jgi:hypothetical protein